MVKSYLDIKGIELPVDFSSQAGYVDTLRDVDGLGELVDVLQRALDTVKDGSQDTRPQFH